ncbi:hypothetical protein BDF20DRAFT_861392 [Mycotypha africana]|uniref:uncharacterized protein n=1 Tax=Mycotypha africana TaxID=64632 RepID=UPI0022FFFEB5|nr:uncharacterized protein BDF20DRAFT_861392 [Mycotypha africana]KAI8984719.1 hypothetical protein BDF20DRAFT_861392 [Mycotypha africana]
MVTPRSQKNPNNYRGRGKGGISKLQIRGGRDFTSTAAISTAATVAPSLFIAEPDSSDRKELFEYMQILDVTENRSSSIQPFVIPERLARSFISRRGIGIDSFIEGSAAGLERRTVSQYVRDIGPNKLAGIPSNKLKGSRLWLLYPVQFDPELASATLARRPDAQSSYDESAAVAGAAFAAAPAPAPFHGANFAAPAFMSNPTLAPTSNFLAPPHAPYSAQTFNPTRKINTPKASKAAEISKPQIENPIAALKQDLMQPLERYFKFDHEQPERQLYRAEPALLKKIIQKLNYIFHKRFPGYYFKFTAYGSAKSGLAFINSSINLNVEMDQPDLDCLKDRDVNPYVSDLDAPYCFNTIRPFLQQMLNAKKVILDEATGFTTIQLQHIKVEYNFNKEIFTRSTLLIEQYIKLDGRVGEFLGILKHFCQSRNLLAPSLFNGMRYYGYVIMALAYLTSLNPPVLPNLQNINFKDMSDTCFSSTCISKKKYWDSVIFNNRECGIAARYHDCISFKPHLSNTKLRVKKAENGTLYWNSDNMATVKKLFIDFLYHYGYELDYKEFAVSLKSLGGYAVRKDAFNPYPVVVEDPFIPGINLAATVDNIIKFRDTLRGAFTCLYGDMTFGEMVRTSDIHRMNNIQGFEGRKKDYEPYMKLNLTPTYRTLLLIGLPDIPEGSEDASMDNVATTTTMSVQEQNCYCVELAQSFPKSCRIEQLNIYDRNTMLMSISAVEGSMKNIVIPNSFTFRDRTVQVVELYETVEIEEQ